MWEQTVAAENAVTISRRRWLQHQIRFANALKNVRGPFVCDSLKLIWPRLLHYAVEISQSCFACLRRDRQ